MKKSIKLSSIVESARSSTKSYREEGASPSEGRGFYSGFISGMKKACENLGVSIIEDDISDYLV